MFVEQINNLHFSQCCGLLVFVVRKWMVGMRVLAAKGKIKIN